MRVMVALLATLALGSDASARTVATGASVKMKRKAEERRLQAFWVGALARDELVDIIVYPTEVVVGDELDIVDDQGLVGRVRVETVTRTNEGCATFTYIRAQGRYLARPTRESSVFRAAVGPVNGRARSDRAKLYIANAYSRTTTMIQDLPDPGPAISLQYAVDLDGDERADLARYFYDCSRGLQSTFSHGEACVDDWARDGANQWSTVATARFKCQ